MLGPTTAKNPTYPKAGCGTTFLPHSVLEGRSKKAGLGSSSNPKNCPQILKQKRGSQPFSHLKWPGVGPNELIGGSGGPLKAAFWLITFSRVQFHCPTFLPLHFFAVPQLPPKNRSSGRNSGKVVRSTAKATPGAGWFLAETGPRGDQRSSGGGKSKRGGAQKIAQTPPPPFVV